VCQRVRNSPTSLAPTERTLQGTGPVCPLASVRCLGKVPNERASEGTCLPASTCVRACVYAYARSRGLLACAYAGSCGTAHAHPHTHTYTYTHPSANQPPGACLCSAQWKAPIRVRTDHDSRGGFHKYNALTQIGTSSLPPLQTTTCSSDFHPQTRYTCLAVCQSVTRNPGCDGACHDNSHGGTLPFIDAGMCVHAHAHAT
jgi:hypothetical protein